MSPVFEMRVTSLPEASVEEFSFNAVMVRSAVTVRAPSAATMSVRTMESASVTMMSPGPVVRRVSASIRVLSTMPETAVASRVADTSWPVELTKIIPVESR